MPPQNQYYMIKLSLIKDCYSPLDGDLSLERLLHEHHDDVVLRCDEPRFKTGGYLERAAAEYISRLLPHEYIAKWDKSTEGYHVQQNRIKELPVKIDELKFRVILQRVE